MSDQATEPTPPAPAPPHRAHRAAQPDQGTRAVASNVEPTTDAEDYAVAARDEAVDARAQRYVDNGDEEAAERYRSRFQDAPAEAPEQATPTG